MPKGIISKIKKEKQIFDENLLYCENIHIIDCYNHFKDRYRERYVKPNRLNDLQLLAYLSYWDVWIKNLVGEFLYFDKDGRMVRLIGSYMKDEILYKIVYTKNIKLNIFVPLTIMGFSDQKKKLRLYKRILSLKRKNENHANS
jgi:hypothetical protein